MQGGALLFLGGKVYEGCFYEKVFFTVIREPVILEGQSPDRISGDRIHPDGTLPWVCPDRL